MVGKVKTETKAMQRARRILADKQAAWDSTMQRIDQEKEKTMAKRLHLLMDDESACGLEWDGESENFVEEYEEVTCKKCLAHAPVHYLLADDETACGLDSAQGRMSEELADVTCEECIEQAPHEGEEECEEEETPAPHGAPAAVQTTILFTLAPASLDKAGTQEVIPSGFLYRDENISMQALRQVQVPKATATAQMNAYLSPTPYVALDEAGLAYLIKKGNVTRGSLEPARAVFHFEHLTTGVSLNDTPQEKTTMAKKPITKVRVATKPEAVITEVVHANMPTPSALDAILATPIAHIMQQAPVGVPEEFLTRLKTPKRPLALPAERSEAEIAQGIKPVTMAQVHSMLHDMSLLLTNLAQESTANRQAITTLVHMVETMRLTPGCGEETPAVVEEPDIWDILGDGTGAATAPGKRVPVSTLVLGKHIAAKTPAPRTTGGKTDPAIVKAIQAAWKSGKTTQADLAVKYGMDSKRVWFFCNRAKQL